MPRRYIPSVRDMTAINEERKVHNEEKRIMIINESLVGIFITFPLISIFGFGWSYFSQNESFVESCQLGGFCYVIFFPFLLFQLVCAYWGS